MLSAEVETQVCISADTAATERTWPGQTALHPGMHSRKLALDVYACASRVQSAGWPVSGLAKGVKQLWA